MQRELFALLILLLEFSTFTGLYGVEAPSLLILPQNPMFGNQGDNVVIICSVTHAQGRNGATPDPQLKWNFHTALEKVSTRQLEDDRVELTIFKLLKSDEGVYTCYSSLYHIGTQVKLIVVNAQQDLNSIDYQLCMPTQFRCRSGHCIFKSFRCNKEKDCPFDDSDELYCDGTYLSCDDNPTNIWYRCSNQQCINRLLVCDGEPDCIDSSDEKLCPTSEVPTMNPYEVLEADSRSWHFNAIYSAVAGVISLACVTAIVIITVCRIHLRREALSHMLTGPPEATRRSRRQTHQSYTPRSSSWHRGTPRSSWQQPTPPVYHSADGERYIPQRYVPTPNVSFNVNLHVNSSGVTELSSLVVAPPPYTEVENLPRGESPPPPYSTLDRDQTSHTNRSKNDRTPQSRGTSDINRRSEDGPTSLLLPPGVEVVHEAHV